MELRKIAAKAITVALTDTFDMFYLRDSKSNVIYEFIALCGWIRFTLMVYFWSRHDSTYVGTRAGKKIGHSVGKVWASMGKLNRWIWTIVTRDLLTIPQKFPRFFGTFRRSSQGVSWVIPLEFPRSQLGHPVEIFQVFLGFFWESSLGLY